MLYMSGQDINSYQTFSSYPQNSQEKVIHKQHLHMYKSAKRFQKEHLSILQMTTKKT